MSDSSENDKHQELRDAIRKFTKYYERREEVSRKLMMNAEARPNHAPPAEGLGSHKERIDQAREIHSLLGKFEFLKVHLAGWMVMSEAGRLKLLANLKKCSDDEDSFEEAKYVTQGIFNNIGSTLSWFLQNGKSNTSKQKTVTATTSAKAPGDDLSSTNAQSIPRKESESTKCRRRDGNLCMVTRSPLPHVCHIVPFAWNSTKDNTKKTSALFGQTIRAFCDKGELKYYTQDLTSNLGCSDRSWNMICLNPYLHGLWSKGIWAFSFVSIDDIPKFPNERVVCLQFHWMKVPPGGTTFKLDDPVDWERVVGFPGGLVASNCAIMNNDTYRPVETGDLFNIRISRDDADRFVRMIKLQWAMIKINAIAGAAGDPDLLRIFDDSEDEEDDKMAHASLGRLYQSPLRQVEFPDRGRTSRGSGSLSGSILNTQENLVSLSQSPRHKSQSPNKSTQDIQDVGSAVHAKGENQPPQHYH